MATRFVTVHRAGSSSPPVRIPIPGTWDELQSVLVAAFAPPGDGAAARPSGGASARPRAVSRASSGGAVRKTVHITRGDAGGPAVEYLEGLSDGDVIFVHVKRASVALAAGGGLLPGLSHLGMGRNLSSSSGVEGVGGATPSGGAAWELLDMRCLGGARATDFEVLGEVAGDADGHVLEVVAQLEALSDARRHYALTIVYNFGVATSAKRNVHQNEADMLSAMPRHPNIARLWAQFLDEVPDSMLRFLPPFQREQAVFTDNAGVEHRRQAQFVVAEHHTSTLASTLGTLREPPKAAWVIQLIGDVLRAIVRLDELHIAHMAVSPDAILVSGTSSAVLRNFGSSIRFHDARMSMSYVPGMSLGTEERFAAPEVLEAFSTSPTATTKIHYAKQNVWAVAVLALEVICGRTLFSTYPDSVGGASNVAYDVADLPTLPDDFPKPLQVLLYKMVSLDPAQRPTSQKALSRLIYIAGSIGVTVADAIPIDVSEAEPSSEAGHGGSPSRSPSRASGRITLKVKSVVGQEVVLDVERGETVRDLKARSQVLLFPDRTAADWSWELLLDRHKLSNEDRVETLEILPDSVLVLLSLSKSMAVQQSTTIPSGNHAPVYDETNKNGNLTIVDSGRAATAQRWGSARLRFPGFANGVSGGVHCFTFRIDNKAPSGGLCIGVCTASFDARVKNVGASPGSWGYSSSGKKSEGDPRFTTYGPEYSTGDLIRVVLDCTRHTLAFEHNGRPLGIASMNLPPAEYYPVICMGGVREGLYAHKISVYGEEEAISSAFTGPVASDSKTVSSASVNMEANMFSVDHKSSKMELSTDGSCVRGHEWGSAAVECPSLRPNTGVYVFKFLIKRKGAKGGICFGVADKLFDMTTKNVGASLGSWGFSSSGMKSDGKPVFAEYGSRFSTGDVVGMDVDTTAGSIRFTINGCDQGIAFGAGLRGHTLVPAVCMGGAPRDDPHEVEVLEVPRAFDSVKCGPAPSVVAHGSTIVSTGWGSAFLVHKGASQGIHTFSIRVNEVAENGGICVGVARAGFPIARSNIGASAGSWAYSNSGQFGSGSARFRPYAERYTTGDVIGVKLDLSGEKGVLTFAKNGDEFAPAARNLPTGVPLIPAVCLGGAKGRDVHSLSVVMSSVYMPANHVSASSAEDTKDEADEPTARALRFSETSRNAAMLLQEDGMTLRSTTWGSAAVDVDAVSSGTVTWTFRITQKAPVGGICIGVIERDFDATRKNVGAASGSWGYSSSGKKGGGNVSFQNYGTPYGTGDVLDMTLDADRGTLSFKKNGESQGVAFADGTLTGGYYRPAVCVGGAKPGTTHAVTLVPQRAPGGGAAVLAAGHEYSLEHRHQHAVISPKKNVTELLMWGSVLIEHPPIESGRHRFWIKVLNKGAAGGICIGVIDLDKFDCKVKNVGASAASWGFSSSGKKGSGTPSFAEYAQSYGTGDVVLMEVDRDRGSLRYWLNGIDQGVAFDRLPRARLGAAVCAGGGAAGAQPHVLAIVQPPGVFNTRRANRSFTFSETGESAMAKDWGTAYLSHMGMRRGTFRWSIRIDHKAGSGGIVIGVADPAVFKVEENHLGADDGSWGFSSLGRKSAGSAEFSSFGKRFGTGDIVGVELNFELNELRFSVNGDDLGIAFSGGFAGRELMPAVCAGGSTTTPHKVTIVAE